MRDPSIHIRKSDLTRLLEPYGIGERDVYDIMRKAKEHSIRDRVFISTKAKQARKMKRTVEAESDTFEVFHKIYSAIMLEQSIMSTSIKKDSPMYLSYKEVADQARTFCDSMGLSYETGFRFYIESAIKVIGKRRYSLYRLKAAHARLLDYYKAYKVWKEDSKPIETIRMYQAWQKTVLKNFATTLDVMDDVTKMVHFIYCREDADALGANYDDWMGAQFDKWSYLNIIPEFSVLYGDNAKLVYKMYMAKQHKTDSKDERNYFNKVRSIETVPLKALQQQEEARARRVQKGLREAGSGDNGV